MDPQAVARYHQDLLGAIIARIPIDFGNATGDSAGTAALGGYANRNKLGKLEQLAGETDQLPVAYRAGLQMYQQSVSPQVVLDGLSWRDQSSRNLSNIVSRSVLYILLIAAVAVAGIAFHHFFVTPNIDSFLADLQIDSKVSQPSDLPDPGNLPMFAVLISVAVLLAMILMAFIGPTNVLRWFGANKYENDLACSAAARAAKELIERGTDKTEAIRVAIDLVDGLPVVTKHLVGAVESTSDCDEISERLESLATHFQALAADRLMVISSLVPALLLILFGGLVAITYGLAVFYPLIDVLRELGQRVP